MPLSEHEQKLLDQMERALYAEDPGFATQMKGTPRSASRTRIVVGVLVAVLGLVVVLLGVNVASIPLGVVGFVIMVAGVAWAATPTRAGKAGAQTTQGGATAAKRVPQPGKAKQQGQPFMKKMDDRWERRRRGED